MPRRKKPRCVGYMPNCTYFKPAGIPARDLDEVVLRVEEMEALRLKDLLGLDQADCAVQMEISRPTFQRILMDARRKVASTLIEGKALRIEGGEFDFTRRRLNCPFCNTVLDSENQTKCPMCEGRLI